MREIVMQKRKSMLDGLVLGLLLVLFSALPAYAQTDDDYRVSLRRYFGYGAGSNVRGTMSISLVGDETRVERITFWIDDTEMTTLTQSPFKFQFQTDDYGFGWHNLSAQVTTKSGQTFTTSPIRYNFVTPEEESSGIKNIFLPLGVVIIAALGISALIQLIGKPKTAPQPGQPRNYGLLGGTICPKCGHAFPRHIWAMNLMVARLDRCDSCGRFVMTRRATPEQLAAAEASEAAQINQTVQPVIWQGEESDQLDESKYIDSI